MQKPKKINVSSAFNNTVEIYNIFNPTTPVHVGQFNTGNLNFPNGLAIFTLFS